MQDKGPEPPPDRLSRAKGGPEGRPAGMPDSAHAGSDDLGGTVLTAPEALGAAREVAATLAADVVQREAAGCPPVREVALLRDAGLLPLLVAADRGGIGADWDTAYRVVRTVAAVDP